MFSVGYVANIVRIRSPCINTIVKTATNSYYRPLPCPASLALSCLSTSSTSSWITSPTGFVTECLTFSGSSWLSICQDTSLALRPKVNAGQSMGGFVPVRGYMRKKTIKVPPTKVLEFNSGDIDTSLPSLDLEQPRLRFENVKELETASGTVKKLFSLQYSGRREMRDKQVSDVIEKIRVKGGLTQDLETNIAMYTVLIRNQMEHCYKFRKDKMSKMWCVGRIRNRKRMLMELRELDYNNFQWLLKELQISYEPPNEYSKFKESKRAKRKRLAREQAIAIRKAKMEDYRQKLEKEKVAFVEFKEKELSDIIEQMKELGMSEKPSLSDMLKELDPVKYPSKNPPNHPRRWYRLNHKFDLHEEKMRLEKAKQPPVNQIQ